MADLSRSSTKYQDDETGLFYYGFRYLSNARWLNHDLVEEEGGLNLYAFVRNDPVDLWDVLGLDANARPCPCGPDIEDSLNATLADVERTYQGWNRFQKLRVCVEIYNPDILGVVSKSQGLANAWDIIDIAQRWPLKNQPCSNTHTFQGHCYIDGSINYAEWGKINKLCFDTFSVSGTLLHPVSPARGLIQTYGSLFGKAFGQNQWTYGTVASPNNTAQQGPSTGGVLPGLDGLDLPADILWGLPSALGRVNLYKSIYAVAGGGAFTDPKTTARIQAQALQFTTYGYTGVLPTASYNSECQPSQMREPAAVRPWVWEPLHH